MLRLAVLSHAGRRDGMNDDQQTSEQERCLICLAPMIDVDGEPVCEREYMVVELNLPYEAKGKR